jgi:hypothetical protein
LGYGDAARGAAREFRELSREVPCCPKSSKTGDWRAFWRLAYPYLKEDDFERVLEGIGKAELPV